jgi:hypothetical protein
MPLNTREHTCAAWTKNVLPPSGQIRKKKKKKTLHLHFTLTLSPAKDKEGPSRPGAAPLPQKKKKKKLLKVFVSQPTNSQLQLGGKH